MKEKEMRVSRADSSVYLQSDYDCSVCEDEALGDDPMGFMKRRFIVCRTCGNKRCPRASAHWQECTDSNEPGQIGSFYGPEASYPVAPSGGVDGR